MQQNEYSGRRRFREDIPAPMYHFEHPLGAPEPEHPHGGWRGILPPPPKDRHDPYMQYYCKGEMKRPFNDRHSPPQRDPAPHEHVSSRGHAPKRERSTFRGPPVPILNQRADTHPHNSVSEEYSRASSNQQQASSFNSNLTRDIVEMVSVWHSFISILSYQKQHVIQMWPFSHVMGTVSGAAVGPKPKGHWSKNDRT